MVRRLPSLACFTLHNSLEMHPRHRKVFPYVDIAGFEESLSRVAFGDHYKLSCYKHPSTDPRVISLGRRLGAEMLGHVVSECVA